MMPAGPRSYCDQTAHRSPAGAVEVTFMELEPEVVLFDARMPDPNAFNLDEMAQLISGH